MSVDSVRDLVFGIIGGSALLMYGVDLMGKGLEKAAGRFIKKILSVLTGKLWSAFLVGTGATALVQSSTAVTVLTVGFVNSNLMSLKQAVGIIYGANIGTTITAQLMAFSFTDMALPIIGIGFVLMYFSKKETVKYIGQGVMGFGMLFLGLKLLNLGVPYLKSNQVVVHFIRHYSSSLPVSIIAGMIATVLVQSSSATVGITMILAQANLISIDGAIGLMLGDNIGTCMTAQVAAAAGNVAARRTAWAHTIYNIMGVIIAIMVIKPFIMLVSYVSPGMPVERLIANSHTLFNVLSAVIFLPVTNYYVRLIEFMVPDRRNGKAGRGGKVWQDSSFKPLGYKGIEGIITTSISLVKSMVEDMISYFKEQDRKCYARIQELERRVDEMQRQAALAAAYGERTGKERAALEMVNDVERFSDNLLEMAQMMKYVFSEDIKISGHNSTAVLNLLERMNISLIAVMKCRSTGDRGLGERICCNARVIEDTIEALLRKNNDMMVEGTQCVNGGIVVTDLLRICQSAASLMARIGNNACKPGQT